MTRPTDGPATDHASPPSRPGTGDAGAARGSDAFAQLEACLLEVRALEDARRPALDRRWAARYRAAHASRDAELAVYWRHQIEMATLHAALAIALLLAGTMPATPTIVLVVGALLGLGLAVGWAVASRHAGRRLAQWDARLEGLDAVEDDDGAAPSGAASNVKAPAAGAGGALLSVVFVVFWAVAALGWIAVPGVLRPAPADGARPATTDVPPASR